MRGFSKGGFGAQVPGFSSCPLKPVLYLLPSPGPPTHRKVLGAAEGRVLAWVSDNISLSQGKGVEVVRGLQCAAKGDDQQKPLGSTRPTAVPLAQGHEQALSWARGSR